MAFQPAPDTAEAVMQFSQNGQDAVNRVNFEKVGGYDQASIDLLAEAVDAAVGTYYIPLLQASINYLGTLVRGLATSIDLTGFNDTNADNGSAAGNGLPQQSSYVIKLGTGFTGRSARGRLYAQAMGASNLTSARTVSTAYADAMVDFVFNLLDFASAAGWTGVITSRQQGGVVLSTAENLTITDIIAGALNLDTQRRRVGK